MFVQLRALPADAAFERHAATRGDVIVTPLPSIVARSMARSNSTLGKRAKTSEQAAVEAFCWGSGGGAALDAIRDAYRASIATMSTTRLDARHLCYARCAVRRAVPFQGTCRSRCLAAGPDAWEWSFTKEHVTAAVAARTSSG